MPNPLLISTIRRSTCPQGFVAWFKGSRRVSLRQPHATGEGVMSPPVEFVDVANSRLGAINHHVVKAFCCHLLAHDLRCHDEHRDGLMSRCNDIHPPLLIRSS